MKSTGIIRRIDDLGRIVIPKDIRKKMGVYEGEPIEFFFSEQDGEIVLKKYVPETIPKVITCFVNYRNNAIFQAENITEEELKHYKELGFVEVCLEEYHRMYDRIYREAIGEY